MYVQKRMYFYSYVLDSQRKKKVFNIKMQNEKIKKTFKIKIFKKINNKLL